MRVESSVTSISWIPSEAVAGMMKMPFEMGMSHYDQPPPEEIDGLKTVDELRANDRLRFANHISGWIDVDDNGVITDWGMDGQSRIGFTRIKAGKTMTFEAMPMPDLEPKPEVGGSWIKFKRTAGGSTGAPAPRRVSHPPFVQWRAPLAWTTLSLTLHADGRVDAGLEGASTFPRHWVYGGDGKLVQKSGLIDYDEWFRKAFGKHTPWGDEDSPAFVAEVESALERELSRTLMSGGSPKIRKVKQGEVLTKQGEQGDELFLLLDGILSVDVDGEVLAELGPGALIGERALLEGGTRTSTLTATTAAKVAVVNGDSVDHEKLVQLAEGHRREEQVTT